MIGKVGTDIEDNKCGWLICQALPKCSPEQRAVLQASYGQKDPVKVKAVKAVYAALDLESLFKEFEEEAFKKISALISGQKEIPEELFSAMLHKIFKRQK